MQKIVRARSPCNKHLQCFCFSAIFAFVKVLNDNVIGVTYDFQVIWVQGFEK